MAQTPAVEGSHEPGGRSPEGETGWNDPSDVPASNFRPVRSPRRHPTGRGTGGEKRILRQLGEEPGRFAPPLPAGCSGSDPVHFVMVRETQRSHRAVPDVGLEEEHERATDVDTTEALE